MHTGTRVSPPAGVFTLAYPRYGFGDDPGKAAAAASIAAWCALNGAPAYGGLNAGLACCSIPGGQQSPASGLNPDNPGIFLNAPR